MIATEKPTIVEALAAVMAEVQAVGKGDFNTEQKYRFRGIDAVVNAVGPVFRKYGIVAVPLLESAGYRDVQTSRGKPSRECTLQVRYRFYGPAGDHIEAVVPGESMDFGDKGAAKAMSVAYRIALLQTLCIPTNDTDPDAQSYERDVDTGPAEKAKELFKAVTEAPDLEALRETFNAAQQASVDGLITERESNQLEHHIRTRKSELEAASPVEAVAE